MRTVKPRLSPKIRDGRVDPKAPFWNDDTAEKVLARRLAERARSGAQRTRSPRSPSTNGGDPRLVRLKRLERNLKRRKTLAARLRIEQQIKLLKRDLRIA